MRFALITAALLCGALSSAACAGDGAVDPATISKAPAVKTEQGVWLETVVEGLENPWGLAFLGNGEMLVNEGAGRMRIFKPGGKLSDPIKGVPPVVYEGQGGLLDVQAAPDFAKSQRIFFSYSEARGGNANGTSVASAKLVRDGDSGHLEDLKVIFREQPAKESVLHFGGRIVFMPDGSLFVTLGERALFRDEAQNPANDLGKLVRIMPDGSPYPKNPNKPGWAPEIWSIGHRNMQGAAINPASGKLWEVEHGARGGDELNIPEAGKNYGWPIITYGIDYDGSTIGEGIVAKKGLEQPIYFWKPSIAPSSLIFYTGDKYPEWKGNAFVGALAGQALHRLVLKGEKVTNEEILFKDQNKRIRNVRQGPDGYLYLVIDSPAPWGQVLRIVPSN